MKEKVNPDIVSIHREGTAQILDVTELNDFFENAMVMLHWVNAEGKIIWANKAEMEALGYAKEEYIGQSVKKFHTDEKIITDILHRLNNLETIQDYPSQLIRKDGSVRDVLISSNVFTKDGKFVYTRCFTRDITEQKIAQTKIEEREKLHQEMVTHLKLATESANVGTWSLNMQTQKLEWSALHKIMWGYDELCEDLVYEDWHKLILPGHKEKAFKKVEEARINHTFYDVEYYIERANDGAVRCIRSVGKYYYNDKGEAETLTGISMDITEQQEVEEKLKYRQAVLEAQNNAIPDGILIVDTKGNMISFNQHFVELWQIPADIVQKKDDAAALQFAMTQLTDPQGFIDRVNYCYNHPEEKVKEEVHFKDGRIIQRYGNAVIGDDGTSYGWAWYFRDITEEKYAQEKIKLAKEQLELTFKNIPGAIQLRNYKGELLLANDEAAKMTGFASAEEMMKEKDNTFILKNVLEMYDVFDEEGKPFIVENTPTINTLKTGMPAEAIFLTTNKKTGASNWVISKSSALLDEDGNVTMVVSTNIDITGQKNAEEKIRQSEEQLRSLANSIPQLAWMTDAEGWIYWYNQCWYDYTGTTLEEMQGWGWQSVHHPDLIEDVTERFKKAIALGEPYEQTFLLRSKEGEYRWFLTRAIPIRNEDGKIVQWFGTNTDVTDQRNIEEALKESEARFRLLADSMPQQIWTADTAGNLNYFNETVYQFSGLLFDDIQKDGWLQVVHPDDREANITRWVHSIKTGEDFFMEHRFKNYAGEYRWQLSRAKPKKNSEGKIQLWVGTSTDIHEQKMNEEKKDEFLSIASHEMKTPLTTAKAYLQMLQMELDESNGQVSDFAKKASYNVDRLHYLIAELLDVSKIQHGKLNYNISSFNFNELIDKTVEDLQYTSPNHTIVKTGSIPHEVYGDKDRLQQVVINLLSNAIKYSPDSKEVYINVEEKDGEVKVSVKDQGIGMSKHHLEKVFGRYYRVEEHAGQFQGLGIGLFISYEIIQRHKGKLWVESEPGKGSTFYFTLPLV